MTKAENIIKDLMDTDWGENNEKQMKAVELLKGLALSDEDVSNQFMKELSNASTVIGKKILNSKEIKESIRMKASSLL